MKIFDKYEYRRARTVYKFNPLMAFVHAVHIVPWLIFCILVGIAIPWIVMWLGGLFR